MRKKKETVEEIVNEVVEEVVEETVTEELLDSIVEETIKEVEENVEEETVEEETVENEVKPITGVVANCAQLNVREKAEKTAKVVCVIAKGTEVYVDLELSTEDFYKVNASGKVGYCVKQFISIK